MFNKYPYKTKRSVLLRTIFGEIFLTSISILPTIEFPLGNKYSVYVPQYCLFFKTFYVRPHVSLKSILGTPTYIWCLIINIRYNLELFQRKIAQNKSVCLFLFFPNCTRFLRTQIAKTKKQNGRRLKVLQKRRKSERKSEFCQSSGRIINKGQGRDNQEKLDPPQD